MEVGQVQVQVHLDQVGQDLVLTMITHVSVLMGTLVIDVKQVNMLSQYTLIAVLFSQGWFPRSLYLVYLLGTALYCHSLLHDLYASLTYSISWLLKVQ